MDSRVGVGSLYVIPSILSVVNSCNLQILEGIATVLVGVLAAFGMLPVSYPMGSVSIITSSCG